MINELKLAVCPRPPTKAVIQQARIKCLQNDIPKMTVINIMPYMNLKEHLEKWMGDKDFMLKVLAHITDRDHVFFNKNYVPPTKQVVNSFKFEFDN